MKICRVFQGHIHVSFVFAFSTYNVFVIWIKAKEVKASLNIKFFIYFVFAILIYIIEFTSRLQAILFNINIYLVVLNSSIFTQYRPQIKFS